ncbi:MAG: 6-carboxytetrahydropterin synthase QueD [Spirochaetes bacterium]|nr:6-carboxytetrahydropterin synthase QueD [Spirochaetota bacterium]
MYELIVEDDFSAAHRLNHYKGDCEQLHGHNWKVQILFESDRLNEIGLAVDFRDLQKRLNKILHTLDHKYLNDIDYFKKNATSTECIARYIYEKMSMELGSSPHVKLKKVTCWESDKSAASYYE